MEDFKEGDRVILVGEDIIPTPSWPVWGSKHSCVGTVEGLGSDSVYIRWDNSRTAAITMNYIQHFTGQERDSLLPNLSFLKHKRKINERL